MEKFVWGWWSAVWWMVVIPPILWLLRYGARKRRRQVCEWITPSLQAVMLPADPPLIRGARFALVPGIFFFSILALMEPHYDFTWQTVERKGIDMIIALDVSRSMHATDTRPSRFERAILEIKNLVNSLAGDRIALVVFSTTAVTQCPLTLDYFTYKAFLDEVTVGMLSGGGTSLAAAITQAVRSFDTRHPTERVLLLISDGESHTGDLDQALESARNKDIKIFAVGLGSREGVPVMDSGQSGEKSYIKDADGHIILTRLEEEDLKKSARLTGGMYLRAGDRRFFLERLYREHIRKLEGRTLEAQRQRIYENRFYIPLVIAFLLLITESLLSGTRGAASRKLGETAS